jgi:hypothetical protein
VGFCLTEGSNPSLSATKVIADVRTFVTSNPQIIASTTSVSLTTTTFQNIAGSAFTVSSSTGTWTTGTNGFTVPQAGLYLVSAGVNLPTTAVAYLQISKNGAASFGGFPNSYSYNSTVIGLNVVNLVKCAATDTLTAGVEIVSGSNQSGVRVDFQAVRICT